MSCILYFHVVQLTEEHYIIKKLKGGDRTSLVIYKLP